MPDIVYKGKVCAYHRGKIEEYRRELLKVARVEPELHSLGYTPLGVLDVRSEDDENLIEQRIAQTFPGTFAVCSGHDTYVLAGEVDDARRTGSRLRLSSYFTLEFMTQLKSGFFVVTSRNPYCLALSSAGYRESYPDWSVDALHRKHQARVRAIGEARAIKNDLKAAAKSIEAFLQETIRIDHGHDFPLPANWCDFYRSLRTFLGRNHERKVDAELLDEFRVLKAQFQPERPSLLILELRDYLDGLEAYFEYKIGDFPAALNRYQRLTFAPGDSRSEDLGSNLLDRVLSSQAYEFQSECSLTGVVNVTHERAAQSYLSGSWTQNGYSWTVPTEREGEEWEAGFLLHCLEGQIKLEATFELPKAERRAVASSLHSNQSDLEPLARLIARSLDMGFREIAYWGCWRVLQEQPEHQAARRVLEALSNDGLSLSRKRLMEIKAKLAPYPLERRRPAQFVALLEEARLDGYKPERPGKGGLIANIFSKLSIGS